MNNNTKELEKKAMYLEDTLQNMQSYSDFLFRKVKRLERQGKKPRELRRKLKDTNDGVHEVFGKADNIWKQIKEMELKQ